MLNRLYTTTFAALALITAATLAGARIADDGGPDIDDLAAMKAMAAYSTPGAEQAWLAKFTGEWTTLVRHWDNPSAPPMESSGMAVCAMELGGRFLTTRVTGQFMGMPYEGMGSTAFDNGHRRFQYTWMDTMGTAIITGQGTLESATDTLNWTTTMFDPVANADIACRQTTEWIDSDRFVDTLFVPQAGGTELKVMEIVYSRSTPAIPATNVPTKLPAPKPAVPVELGK
ncbi:MAG: DUF1579 domain-containing protein [Phycisphaerales bacterium]|nr:DUF1579 domain-containing protein [Phycisphaerales bacterium]